MTESQAFHGLINLAIHPAEGRIFDLLLNYLGLYVTGRHGIYGRGFSGPTMRL